MFNSIVSKKYPAQHSNWFRDFEGIVKATILEVFRYVDFVCLSVRECHKWKNVTFCIFRRVLFLVKKYSNFPFTALSWKQADGKNHHFINTSTKLDYSSVCRSALQKLRRFLTVIAQSASMNPMGHWIISYKRWE